ncbi:MAG: transaldolase [Xanthomonadaceae bacterium]|nr:transaldolase [Xanthomonadaceae bacterium]MDP2186271.1 transaldolase [Xanthomonadales bacterium]MDZ4117652.1 transaldolase [Xanthomonadaceae bacterium]MDZ4379316.1 transaldolase [Xanthomonadaceae bacterium]
MKATQALHDSGQSLWLDNITRDLLDSGTLKRYIDTMSITGLTSNPSIFEKAIGNGNFYDDAIAVKARAGKSGEELFTEIALEDLRRAADLLRPVFERSKYADGWVSMEVSPLLAYDAKGSIAAGMQIHQLADRVNLFVKIPGTPPGLQAIEELIFAGVPVNVTLLFSSAQYLAAADAYQRGLERRIEAGLDADIRSVASLFVSRWDVEVHDQVPANLRNQLGIAICGQTYRCHRQLRASRRWQHLARQGAHSQRLLWASTGSKDPFASETMYVEALAAPDTINTMPEKTLLAFAKHGVIDHMMVEDGLEAEAMLARFTAAGVDLDALALQLQKQGAQAFVASWQHLLQCIADKMATAARAAPAQQRQGQ